MTPNPVRNRQRRCKPLPLCLSDNEKDMPVLTAIPSEEKENAHVRINFFSYIENTLNFLFIETNS